MGVRVLQVAPFLVERWLTEGLSAWEPISPPRDIEILSARMTFTHHPTIELLVKSRDWDGVDTDTFDVAKRWAPVFRTPSPLPRGGKDAGKRGV